MRLLLDDCIDERLRHLFSAHECHSARYAGLGGLKNGNLILAAEAAGYEVLITVDQSIPDQQNLKDRRIACSFCTVPTNRHSDLKHLVPPALEALNSIEIGQVVRIR